MTDHHAKQLAYYADTGDYEKAGWLRRGLTYAYERKARIIAKAIRGSDGRVFEVGAGSGLMTYYLAAMVSGRITANDLSQPMLDAARERVPDIDFHCGDGADTSLPAESFTAICGVDIIHHLEKPVAAFAEWLRISKPGAVLCFLESNPWNPLNLRNIGVEHEVRSFLNTPANLQRWAREAGWANVEVRPAPSFTPAGPAFLRPILNVVDAIGPRLPLLNRLTALWLLTAHTKDCTGMAHFAAK